MAWHEADLSLSKSSQTTGLCGNVTGAYDTIRNGESFD
jgi:hypothetical protein